MGGSSLGGLVTLYLGMRYPDVYGKLAVFSPSVWWRDRVILKYIERIPKKTGQRIWLDIGTSEGRRAMPDPTRTSNIAKSKVASTANTPGPSVSPRC